MKEGLFEAISCLVWELEPDRLRLLVEAIRKVPRPEMSHDLFSMALGGEAARCLESLIREWRENGDLDASALALAMEAAAHVHRKDVEDHSIEIVWTGPSTEFVPVRRTEQVLLELIRSAEASLFLVSFVAHGIPSVEEALREAIARGVDLSILVERGKEHGGALSFDPVVPMIRSLPGAKIYTWPPEKREGYGSEGFGTVHAKCAVADGKIVFVTSANLTAAAMERNMELGLLVTGGWVPRAIQKHLEALVTTGEIVRVEE